MGRMQVAPGKKASTGREKRTVAAVASGAGARLAANRRDARSGEAESAPSGVPRPSSSAGKPKPAPKTKGLAGDAFPVVGIGASAGGFEAFTALLENLPADCGLAIVIVQHVDPHHESRLPELLVRSTKMPVHQVKDGEPVRPNEVFVIPPNVLMEISDGILHLVRQESGAGGRQRTVDHFLASLAADRKDRALGVILSGTASDGTAGLKAIKAEGGITFAQDPATAKYDGMPSSAIAAGCVDLVLSPPAIAAELANFARRPPLQAPRDDEAAPVEGFDAVSFGKILHILRAATKVDFGEYKQSTLQRRMGRRMALLKVATLAEYQRLLLRSPEEVQSLFHDALINLTGFFRDPGTFDALKRDVFPHIAKREGSDEPVRIWVPGCSTGEEVYSIAMALLEYLEERKLTVPIQIFGTDLSESVIAKAREGFYKEGIESEVGAARLRRFFQKGDGGYRVSKAVRALCVFSLHNVARDPPFSRLDIVSCRNVLIYFGAALQKKVFASLHFALKPSGFLVLGTSETTGPHSEWFQPVDPKRRIYVKKAGILPIQPREPPSLRRVGAPGPPGPGTKARPHPFDVGAEADRIVTERYAPAGVVVNAQFDVVLYRGRVSPFLEPAPGQPNLSVLRMARKGLDLDLRAALHEAAKREIPVRRENVVVRSNGSPRRVNLQVHPFLDPGTKQRYYFVLFESGGAVPARPRPLAKKEARLGTSASDRRAVELEKELEAVHAELRTVMEDQETAVEELQTANEEALSTNEELQSTNEELQTASEELQSTNEELTTLNEELTNRTDELLHTNSDLINFLTGVRMPILFLDGELRLRRFTPLAEKAFNVLPGDVGRPITDIRLKMEVPRLRESLLEVIDTVREREMDVRDAEGHSWSMRLLPYRTIDNRIDGAVMVFGDVDVARKASELVAEKGKALEVLNRKLGDEARERAKAQEERNALLARSNQHLELFARALSHDVLEPLRMISSYAKLLESRYAAGLDEDGRSFLGTILEGAGTMDQMIQGLLRVSRWELNPVPSAPVDAEKALAAALRHLEGPIRESGAVVTRGKLPVVLADEGQLTEVFQNLVANAIKFRGERPPRISVSAKPEGALWRISVEDNGPGIAADHHDHIFALFYREDKSKPGTGLGLYLTKRIVESHGGSIRFESAPGEGTTFHVTLPAAKAGGKAAGGK